MTEEYNARECIEYAISCLKNRDSRGCTIKWLERALAQMDVGVRECGPEYEAAERCSYPVGDCACLKEQGLTRLADVLHCHKG